MIKDVPQEKAMIYKLALDNPLMVQRAIYMNSLLDFFIDAWPTIVAEPLELNWHIKVFCDELQDCAEKIAKGEYPGYDYLIFNIPPGSTKSAIISRVFPVWCWARWYWFRFITGSYDKALALELAEDSRDIIQSAWFQKYFPDLQLKQDKQAKSNFKLIKIEHDAYNKGRRGKEIRGGGRISTSVKSGSTGFHATIIIVDDPLDPRRAISKVEIKKANDWISETLSGRKVNKGIVPVILVMQRLHPMDCTAHLLEKARAGKVRVKQICLPASIEDPNIRKLVIPQEYVSKYQNNLLDPVRLNRKTLKKQEGELGQYGYSAQMNQNPVPAGQGMFDVDKLVVIDKMPAEVNIVQIVRYWDKAATDQAGAYTAGVKIAYLRSGKFIIMDVRRGQWATDKREAIIRATAEADGVDVKIYMEQEPGSGGKDSVQASIKNLEGFAVYADRPSGDKIYRADPYSVSVNNGNVQMMRGMWNHDYVQELKLFPFGQYKDQVDASSGAYSQLMGKVKVRIM